MSLPAFKRPDGVSDRVYVVKTHRTHIPAGVCCPDRATKPASVKLEDIAARRIDMHALRRSMPERWSHFCRQHFRNSIELAAFFGTDERTARFWLEGKYAPNASVALRAVTSFPDAIPCLMEGDC